MHRFALRLALIGLMSWGCATASAADFDAAKLVALRQRMQRFVDDGTVAGMVTVVGSSKGVAALDTYGLLSLESAKPMPTDAMFRIASVTKPITATAILLLQEQGKLSVDDPVEKHLPEFRGQMLIAERSESTVTLKKPPRPITLRDLLTHTSGLPGGYPNGLADLYASRKLSLAESVYVISQRPLEFEPGTKWAYCNAGMDTLGRVVEVVSGVSYEAFLTSHVFAKLGMHDTTFYPQGTQRERVAGLYDRKDDKLVRVERPFLAGGEGARHPVPAGGLYSTAPDLARWYGELLKTHRDGPGAVLPQSTLRVMTVPQTGDIKTGFVDGMSFGYGFAVVKEPTGVTAMLSPGSFGHGGAFGNQAWADPVKDVYMIVMLQRLGIPNADGSELRREFQQLAVDALVP